MTEHSDDDEELEDEELEDEDDEDSDAWYRDWDRRLRGRSPEDEARI